MAILAGMYHELIAAPQVGDWIAEADCEPLDEIERAAVREFRRVYTNVTCLSSDFVLHQIGARVRSEQLWRELRPRGDWKSFLPVFEGIVTTAREEAQLRAAVLKLDPYDAMLEQYDPGSRAVAIEPIFCELKSFLKNFIPEVMAHQQRKLFKRPAKSFNAPFPIEKQKSLGLAVMRAMNFDFNHGRLDVSHHPFCSGVPSPEIRLQLRCKPTLRG